MHTPNICRICGNSIEPEARSNVTTCKSCKLDISIAKAIGINPEAWNEYDHRHAYDYNKAE